jgi:hypothetical protein
MRSSSQKRFRRVIDPFAHSDVAGDKLAMADIEGKRRPTDDHDHVPHLWDPEPWSDDKRSKRRKPW